MHGLIVCYILLAGMLLAAGISFDPFKAEPQGYEHNAEIEELPWMAQLIATKDGKCYCGGSLIHERYVLSAGHCVDGLAPSGVKVILNSTKKNCLADWGRSRPNYNTGCIVTTVVEIYTPYRSTDDCADNDIALLELPFLERVRMIKTIHLPNPNEKPHISFEGVDLEVAGWGSTTPFSSPTDTLHKAIITGRNPKSCKRLYKCFDSDTEICAGGDNRNDSCEGDSGGPLMAKFNGVYYVVGIIKEGLPCAQRKPSVYTKVQAFYTWINETIEGDSECM